MPEAYNAVDAVGHLEIRFPVRGHSSLLALESLLAGKGYLSNIELPHRFCNLAKIKLNEKDYIIKDSFNKALLSFQKQKCEVKIDTHRAEWNEWIDKIEKFFLEIIYF